MKQIKLSFFPIYLLFVLLSQSIATYDVQNKKTAINKTEWQFFKEL